MPSYTLYTGCTVVMYSVYMCPGKVCLIHLPLSGGGSSPGGAVPSSGLFAAGEFSPR